MITKNQIYQLLWTTEDKGYLTDQIFALIQQSQQWQPIETAPKDGTELLLSCEAGIDIGYYDDYEDSFGHTLSGEWSSLQGRGAPSHWKPLPKPPEVK